MSEDAKVGCIMPCRTVPHPAAWKAALIACAPFQVPVNAPYREPRDRNRNVSAQRFLDAPQKFTHALWIDDDTVVPPWALTRLLEADKDIICGVQPLYMSNCMVANVMGFADENGDQPHWPDWLTWEPPTEPFKIQFCGFGCVLIKRHVFERIEFPWFVEDHGDKYDRDNTTEDVNFCRKALRADFDIWCHPDVVCGHMKTVNLNVFVPLNRCEIPYKTIAASSAA